MNTMTSILVVDDQRDLLDGIQVALEIADYKVFTATDGINALAILQSNPINLILTDIAMPNMNGYQFFERVQESPEWVSIPFIFLTGRAFKSDIRYGKELGVDDYLTKPIQPEDLLSVVRGKLRRAQRLSQSVNQMVPQPIDKSRTLSLGRLRIDLGQHRVWMDEVPIKLSAREFVLLEYLSQRAEQVVSPQKLIRVTHGLETDSADAGSLLRPLIRAIRRKLGYPVGEMGCIENVRGVGYRINAPTA